MLKHVWGFRSLICVQNAVLTANTKAGAIRGAPVADDVVLDGTLCGLWYFRGQTYPDSTFLTWLSSGIL